MADPSSVWKKTNKPVEHFYFFKEDQGNQQPFALLNYLEHLRKSEDIYSQQSTLSLSVSLIPHNIWVRIVGWVNPYLMVVWVECQTCLSAQDQHADPPKNAEISSNVTQVFENKLQAFSNTDQSTWSTLWKSGSWAGVTRALLANTGNPAIGQQSELSAADDWVLWDHSPSSQTMKRLFSFPSLLTDCHI